MHVRISYPLKGVRLIIRVRGHVVICGGNRSARRKPTHAWGEHTTPRRKATAELSFEPATFVLRGNSASHCATMQHHGCLCLHSCRTAKVDEENHTHHRTVHSGVPVYGVHLRHHGGPAVGRRPPPLMLHERPGPCPSSFASP
ncbi:uncharacterized protein [Nothobranchius furzeri]|uniref:uncharacterized protein isoform X1 n=1 Tax=Nothobranchius furzeri TaxID=105023 RepID=UPI003904D3AD